ncbi:MAG: hypothetical protein ABFC96_09860 [Thermoguttaceae bacterium]
MQWIAVPLVVVLVPALILFVVISAVAALVARRWIRAAIFGPLAVAAVVAVGILCWQAHAVWHPTPHHFQDLDHIPKEAADGLPPSFNIAVDHVYFYNARLLRSDQFFRCHIVHRTDFEKYRGMIRRMASSDLPEEEKDDIEKWLGKGAGEYKTIRSWWDWPDKPACEIVHDGAHFLIVFDEANSTVYVARGGD